MSLFVTLARSGEKVSAGPVVDRVVVDRYSSHTKLSHFVNCPLATGLPRSASAESMRIFDCPCSRLKAQHGCLLIERSALERAFKLGSCSERHAAISKID